MSEENGCEISWIFLFSQLYFFAMLENNMDSQQLKYLNLHDKRNTFSSKK